MQLSWSKMRSFSFTDSHKM
uniref:Uncharacterized protein n=1 Tax=Anguilla anguilla TaxID=7936 RepID=A0A0E9VJL5_ANGAN